ncbi:MAG: ExbD/TolR family protein [Phycisphaeraceae bacterium]
MAIQRRQREDAEINVSSFADIAFLLIIFFILATTLVQNSGAKLDIPAGEQDESEQEEQWPTVSLTPDTIGWGEEGRPVSFEELRDLLAELDLPRLEADQRVVILNTAPEVSYQRYFEVVLAINEAGGVLGLVDDSGRGGGGAGGGSEGDAGSQAAGTRTGARASATSGGPTS